MGLINSVTHDELKAILAHEFGHFSQKSMKVGSYVYHVNHIIYNLLYDNGSYDVMVQKLANVSSYFVLFITIAIKIKIQRHNINRPYWTNTQRHV